MDSSEDSGNNASNSSEEYNSSDFEEVPMDVDAADSSANGIVITVPHEGSQFRGRFRGKDDPESIVRREMNRCIREFQEDLHKVSLLCLVSVGLHYNSVLRSETVLSVALSTLPSQQAYPPKHLDLAYMEKFLKWFRKAFKAEVVAAKAENDLMIPKEMESKIVDQLQKKEAASYNYLICIFVVILRSLGVDARLAWSLKPNALKPESKDLMKAPDRRPTGTAGPRLMSTTATGGSSMSDPKPSTSRSSSSSSQSTASASTSTSSGKGTQVPKPLGSRNKEWNSGPMLPAGNLKNEEVSDNSDSDDSDSPYHFVPTLSRRKRKKSADLKKKPTPVKAKPSGNRNSQSDPKKMKKRTDKTPSEAKQRTSKAATASDAKAKLHYDMWAEVYLEEEERWVSVDLTLGSVLCDSALEAKATPPLDYVLAFGNQGYLKDVTRRYASQWLTATQKRRVDSGWLQQAFQPFGGSPSAKDKAEDECLDQQIMNLPVPKTVQELRNHPLYALRRHLRKFEAIYPEDAPPVGFVNSEPIFRRECVKTLHTKDLWMRQAKAIRTDEVPYKIVKSRPKYDKHSRTLRNDNPPAELFGEWQTEDFIPMPAVDGRVPRNDYGNVELFQASMLPGGTVHLRVSGLQRIARKLDIDCARAVVGFNYLMGGCIPVFDGFVVCEEFKDALMDAYNEDLAREEAESNKAAAQKSNDKKDDNAPPKKKRKKSLAGRLRLSD